MRARKVLRTARREVTKNADEIDRKTLAVGAAVLLLVALVAPVVAGGVGLEDGLYRVGVESESPYYEPVAADDRLQVVSDAGPAELGREIELLIQGETVRHADSAKGLAARGALGDAVERYNTRILGAEPNQTAAFPVEVALEFREQTQQDSALVADDGGADSGGSEPSDTDTDSDANGDADSGSDADDESEASSGTTDDTGAGGDGRGDGDDTTGDDAIGGDSEDGGIDGIGGIGSAFGSAEIRGSPADISPPFPFQSLMLVFVFVVPQNFLIQAYGSTILDERINRRGELLLVSPVSRGEIIAGKTLPYFLGGLLVEAAIAVGVFALIRGELGGMLSVLAVTPLVGLFLGATFLGAMFARSFKELTFTTVTITVVLTAYSFVPAIFADVGAIALISPLTLVVRELQGEANALGDIVFSTLAPTLAAVALFGFGAGLYREEDMFDQRSIPGKVLDALAGPIARPRDVGIVTAALVPLVFVLQLLAVAVLFALGEISVLLILVVVAVVEELAKSVHIYAAHERGRFDRSARTALILGVVSGVAFFLAEKVALVAQLVGLPELRVGEAALQGVAPSGPVLAAALVAPLVLHVSAAAISAAGVGRGRRWYVTAVGVAMLVHLVYNLTVVVVVA